MPLAVFYICDNYCCSEFVKPSLLPMCQQCCVRQVLFLAVSDLVCQYNIDGCLLMYCDIQHFTGCTLVPLYNPCATSN